MATYDWQERHIIDLAGKEIALETKDLHVYYGTNESIKGIDMKFEKNKITALIGPSGSGKSTYLRSLNRMNDTIPIAKVTGEINYQGAVRGPPAGDQPQLIQGIRRRDGLGDYLYANQRCQE